MARKPSSTRDVAAHDGKAKVGKHPRKVRRSRVVDSRTPLDPDRDSVGWPWVLTTLQTASARQVADRAWKRERDTREGRHQRRSGDACDGHCGGFIALAT